MKLFGRASVPELVERSQNSTNAANAAVATTGQPDQRLERRANRDGDRLASARRRRQAD